MGSPLLGVPILNPDEPDIMTAQEWITPGLVIAVGLALWREIGRIRSEMTSLREDLGGRIDRLNECRAHLIRQVRFLTQSTHPAIAQYGQRLLAELKALFRLIHRREHLRPQTFQRRLEQARERFLQKA